MKILSIRLCVLSVLSWLTAAAQNPCRGTPVQDVYENWKKEVLNQNATEKEVKVFAERARLSLPTFDPFMPIAYDTLERKRKNETDVWEDDSIMVVLDVGNRRNFLVVPKAVNNFIVDASPILRANLATVAAATSDAIRRSLSASCDSFASIYIHPPRGLGVWQLHIHVESQYTFKAIGQSEFNSGVRQVSEEQFVG